jgi:hypothetical protein
LPFKKNIDFAQGTNQCRRKINFSIIFLGTPVNGKYSFLPASPRDKEVTARGGTSAQGGLGGVAILMNKQKK